jgi:hypothetical protein
VADARVSLMVLRAWVEEGSQRPLRVEIRRTADVGCGFESELVVSDAAGVEVLVRAWLADVLANG